MTFNFIFDSAYNKVEAGRSHRTFFSVAAAIKERSPLSLFLSLSPVTTQRGPDRERTRRIGEEEGKRTEGRQA